MKRFLNGAMLVCWVLAFGYAVFAFGGATLEWALPFYVLGALLAALGGAKLLWVRPVSWVWTPLHIPVLAFLVYTVARYFTSPIEYESRLELLHVLLFTLVYFVAAGNFYRASHRNIIFWVIAGIAVAESVYGFWQVAMKTDAVLWFTRAVGYRGRASGTYICPNHLAGLLTMTLGLIVARLVVDRRPSRSLQKSFLLKLFDGYCALIIAAGLVATQSRGGWAAAAVALIVAVLWMWRAKALPPRVVDVLLLLIVVGGLVLASRPTVRDRLHQMFAIRLDYTFDFDVVDVRDESLSGRVYLNRSTRAMVADHPLWGAGPGTWRWVLAGYRDPKLQLAPRHAHNDVMQLAAEYGLVGLMLVLGVIGCFLWQIVRFTRPDEPAETRAWMIGSATAVLAMVVHSFADFNLHIPVNAYLLASLLGLTAAFSAKESPCRRVEAVPPGSRLVGAVVLVAALMAAWLAVPLGLGQRLLLAGNDEAAAGEWANATALHQRAVRLDPRSPAAHMRLGDDYRLRATDPAAPLGIAESQQLLADAVQAYERSLALNPFDTDVRVRLALAHDARGETPQARAALENALIRDPNNSYALLRAGIFYLRHGEIERGRAALEKSAGFGNARAHQALTALKAKLPAAKPPKR